MHVPSLCWLLIEVCIMYVALVMVCPLSHISGIFYDHVIVVLPTYIIVFCQYVIMLCTIFVQWNLL